jgi:LysR family transcriptional regulator, benzoate and cis,cis-muconate-responsive activator of ben and cat genes
MLRSAADRAQRSGSGQTGRLDIGLYGSSTFGVVSEVLRRSKAGHPDVDVGLHYGQTPAQCRRFGRDAS